MHPDLQEVIEQAKQNRDKVISGERGVKEANTINNANDTVVTVHTLDLRRRVFEANMAGAITSAQTVEHSDAQPKLQQAS